MGASRPRVRQRCSLKNLCLTLAELSASSTPADSVLTDEGSVTVVVETEVIDGSGAAAVLLPSSAVAGGAARGIAVQLLRVSTPPLVGWQEGGKLGGYGLVV